MGRYNTRSTGITNYTGKPSNNAQMDARSDRKRPFTADKENTADGNAGLESESKKEKLSTPDNKERLLVENSKLKYILREKDQAIRKQFNLIVTWEKEILDVCKNYYNKISETSEMLKALKQSNIELRQTISKYQTQKSSLVDGKSKRQLIHSKPGTSKDAMVTNDYNPTERELLLIAQVRDLRRKLNDNSEAHLKYQEAENRHIDGQQQSCEKFETNRKELILMQKIDDSYLSDLIEYDDCIVGLKMKYLKEVISMLQKLFQKSEKKGSDNLEILKKCDFPNKKPRLEDSSEVLNEKLQKLIACFAKQCIQSFNIINLSEECDNVVKIFTEARIDSCNILRKDEKNNNKSADYCNILIDQQLQMIKDERVVRNVQEQLFKVLSDYDKVVNLLESLKNDDPEIENISNKRCIIDKKKRGVKERNELFNDTPTKECRSLCEENSMLCQRVSALETENKVFQRDNKLLKETNRKQLIELCNLRNELISSKITIIELRDTNSTLLNNQNNEILAYRMQADVREIDYIQLEESERNHVQQIRDLTSELLRLREGNNAVLENEGEAGEA